jgi:predicted transcriptional regulator of viral defense system
MTRMHASGNQAHAMVDEDGRKATQGGAGTGRAENAAAERRKARLAEQLRANLQRRKQQARARRAGEADERKGLDAEADGSKN